MTVRSASVDDLDGIVEIHGLAFPGFFMTRMGSSFLRAYYALVLEYDGGIVLVAENDDRPLGFVAGFENPGRFYAHMSWRKQRMVWPILKGLIRRPALVSRIVFNRKRVEAMGVSGAYDTTLAELSSIGVDSRVASRGIGGALLEAFLTSAAAAGVKQVCLTTAAQGNDTVNTFYKKHGFKLHGSISYGCEREMNEYRIDLS